MTRNKAVVVIFLITILFVTKIVYTDQEAAKQRNIDLEYQLEVMNSYHKQQINDLQVSTSELLTLYNDLYDYMAITKHDNMLTLERLNNSLIQVKIDLDSVSHESCESKIEELQEEVDYLRKMVK